MDDEVLLEKIKAFKFWTGKSELTIEDLAVIQPGLARIMPEIGHRTWKMYYAAKAGNWVMAKFQMKEVQGLMELGALTRPKHEEALIQFLAEDWKPVGEAIDREDFALFEEAFHRSIEAANAYHDLKDKPYIVWKLPEMPPFDLDLKPRRKS